MCSPHHPYRFVQEKKHGVRIIQRLYWATIPGRNWSGEGLMMEVDARFGGNGGMQKVRCSYFYPIGGVCSFA